VWWATNNKKEKTLAAGLKVKVTAVPLLVGHLGLAHNTTRNTRLFFFCLFTTLCCCDAATLSLHFFRDYLSECVSE
jgi:hypothetical protein